MECQKCKKVLSKKGAHFMCQGSCQGTFHRSCVKGLAADMKAGKNRIYCNNCEDEGSDEEEVEEEVQDLEKILKDIQKKVSAIPGLKKHLDTIQQSISVLSDKYDTLLFEHEESKGKISKLEKTVANINNRCVYLEKYNIALEQKLQDAEQQSLKQNLEIVGVEYIPGEKLREIVTKIGDEIGVKSNDIEWVKRNIQAKKENKPSSIMVGFKPSGIESREEWLVNRRKLIELNSSVFTGGSATNKVYINENLTKATKTLLWNAKRQLKGTYKYIWVTNGKILAKKKDGDNTIWIRSEIELGQLSK
ncbi:hypothetical protein B5X24_HaOG216424 [Helicoverpa armigera]|uniref:FP protein C-terminal domain-containing protein n=1 Tax=Helicoverpa armigera TaxID=29058 RepID=A0A2W1BBI9_HELAM|nr:hypothetical protein B5X24_HaOG216424 [Helicoverpa armigera]